MARKIMMATMSLGIGGAETHIVELASELRRRGDDVVIASNGGVYVSDIEKLGIRHYQVPMNRRNVLTMLRSYFLLRKIIKKEEPDMVHAHARISAFICGLLHKTMHFPFVTTAHWVFDISGSLRYLTNWGQKTIAVSEDIKDYLVKNYKINERDIFVTINGIDTEKFSSGASGDKIIREFGLDSTHPIISYVSRLDTDRALVASQLIDLALALDKKLPGVQLLIAGGGDVYDALKTKADAVNAAARRQVVAMTGPRTDINEIIAAGDIFIGVSRAALEAMASEKPVILAGNEGYIGLFSSENLPAAQESNFCCRGFTASSEALLLSDILRCFEMTPEGRAALGAEERRLILSDYSVSRMTNDCQKAYDAVRPRKYSVVMSGYYGFGNAGDEAILQSIHQNIEGSGGDIAITVLSSDPEDTKIRYGYDAVNRFAFIEVLNTLRRCDALVSGGGSLLQDHTSTRSLMYYLMIIQVAEMFHKKVMVYANGIGPVRKKINRMLVRRIVGKADVITLRDAASAQELLSMGVRRADIRVTADPVFTLIGATREEARGLLSKSGIPLDKPYVCVSVRNWSTMGTFKEKVAALCDDIAENFGRTVIFIAMQTPNDIGISYDVVRLMKSKACVLDTRYTAEQIMGIIGGADFVLAMRLHTLIFSARMCVPLIGMIYDPKVEAYIKALDMPSAGDVKNFDIEEVKAAVRAVTGDREKYVSILKNKSIEFEVLAREDAKLLVELLQSEKKRRT
ncbi:polysaccharide pyruvyl transferase CsaB [Sporobacter termitidis DSM 10068]|uniref:Polysaccharide pyruvyl transferase CsaB n=1 Tax=Sporobacter termitidis DSM 10068 TaxID=1123282 RepID=A0A1M5WY24_9FIRM|nr:polysaccharide pyruvyl transferase CsaB [Sporobacter termitidis]SHH92074.1 polysaccharide pyruvyl transferase CsaB [Sporobacter termitidis DSM 10068]